MIKKDRMFAIYRGDDNIFEGTLKECADFLGIKKSSAYFMSTPTYARRGENRKNDRPSRRTILVLLEDD